MDWLEVALTVNGELAEAVADVLGRFAPNGVSTEQGVKHVDEEDDGTAEGPITVRAYLPMNDSVETTRRQIEESLYYLGRIQPLPEPVFTPVADQNWMETWKRHYRPIEIGDRLLVVPEWMAPSASGRISIKINPGMAFGTGTHPSTQLCLELIEEEFRDPGAKVGGSGGSTTFIDVGCGSGILAIAALSLGATGALGVDIDPQAIDNARENAAINGIGEELVLHVGSLTEILDGKFPIRSGELVAANILAPVIIRLLGAGLADVVTTGGTLVLGGILQEQLEGVLEAACARALQQKDLRRAGDWVALSLAK